MEVESWKRTKFLMLKKMLFPSSMAARMVLKSSSTRIMSAASLDTSVPDWPIATPMSAILSAGASFTPSPVIVTTCSSSWNARTIFILCAGETR